MRVVVGGTFEFLHKGHRELIKKAFEIGDFILIGITSDNFKEGIIKNFDERRRMVENYAKNFGKRYKIVKIEDKYGPTLDEDFDAIVVSKETKKTGDEINEMRRRREKKEMKIYEVNMVMAEDLLPISSSRIKNGEIDCEGRRMKKMKVHIGSTNPSKIKAVREIFEKIFNFEIEFIGIEVNSDVPPQPFGHQTILGAINRARKSIKDADYSVGIEAGLFWNEEIGDYFDSAFCAILDKYGKSTFGHSGGFIYPKEVIEMVKNGLEVGEAMEKLSGIKNIKRRMGAIGFLSKGAIERHEFNSQAVLMAMLPRISYELYF